MIRHYAGRPSNENRTYRERRISVPGRQRQLDNGPSRALDNRGSRHRTSHRRSQRIVPGCDYGSGAERGEADHDGAERDELCAMGVGGYELGHQAG
jgi:hypothetical protein